MSFLISYDSQAAFAQNFIAVTADTQLAYADHCFENQDYMAAAAEYKKFIYFFPNDERVGIAGYQIGMSYFFDKSYIRALNQFTQIFDEKGLKDTGISSAFMISQCYQRVQNYPSAINNLIYIKQMTEDIDLTDKIYFHLGWLYLESGDFDRARNVFSSISVANQAEYLGGNFNSDLNAHASIAQKNPIFAGVFSIIPGGGYLYCGRYRDAATAFLINGAFIYGAYESFDEGLYAIGGMMAVVGLGFYAGNIYGGVSSAHKYNQRKQNEFVQRLKKKYNPELTPALSLRIKSKDILLGMTIRF